MIMLIIRLFLLYFNYTSSFYQYECFIQLDSNLKLQENLSQQVYSKNNEVEMPTVFQFLENPELFLSEQTLSNHPDILNSLIDYVSKNPDPMLQNQQQCYVYPNRAADILSLGTTYRAVIAKRQKRNKKTNQDENFYPYLDRLFRNLQTSGKDIQDCLLGYTNKVLISFAKKTPEIYQFIKDNQYVIGLIVKNSRFLRNFKQFIVTFLIESTMGLYSFLKNVVIRAIMFRIIDQKDVDDLAAYESLLAIYSEISKKLKSTILPQDERQQLDQICVNFHDQDFMTLLILKVSCKNSSKTFYIGKLLNEMLSFPSTKVLNYLTINHVQVIQEYFETYEQSQNFMEALSTDQLEMLKFLVLLYEKEILQQQHGANLLKRLLVYTSIHKKNSILHNFLMKLIQIITLRLTEKQQQSQKQEANTDKEQSVDKTEQKVEQDVMVNKADGKQKFEIFAEISVIPFLMKNMDMTSCKYSYGSLIWKICDYWQQNMNELGKYLQTEQQKQFVKQQVESRSKRLVNLNQYKAAIPNNSQIMTAKSQLNPDTPQKQQTSPQSKAKQSSQIQSQEDIKNRTPLK